MFGKDIISVQFLDGALFPTHRYSRGKLTAKQGTRISAVALLREEDGEPSMTIFHNHFARVPLDYKILASRKIQHLKHSKGLATGGLPYWESV